MVVQTIDPAGRRSFFLPLSNRIGNRRNARSNSVEDLSNAGEVNVGVRMMDRDHAEISGMALELKLHAAGAADWSRTGPLLREMARAAASHFVLEESLMEATRYPGLVAHRLRHQWMIDQFRTLQTRCRRKGLAVNETLLDLLVESHFAHIEKEDLRYGLWLNGSGETCSANPPAPEQR
jgi:hemerythrin-like metal-binding protein